MPVYWDFVYFAFTFGMTFQTSDVTISDAEHSPLRHAACLGAFVFNIGVLAFTINVLGSALGGDLEARAGVPPAGARRGCSRRRSSPRRPA